jgi:tetraprenyl-beta-curcumene synthase
MDHRRRTPSAATRIAGHIESAVQIACALTFGTARELCWGLAGVRREVRRWRGLAAQIPDPVLRADALDSLADKRYYLDGAAFFWTLPSRRVDGLLQLLVAYQTIANYLDYASERGAEHRGASGGSLMLALVDAVDVEAPLHDYYAEHPWTDDGGYLRQLVLSCQSSCLALPHYRQARPLLISEARRGYALELCHDPDPRRRDAALARLSVDFGTVPGVSWFELAGSATSLLAVIVLLAVAADETSTDGDLHAAVNVYRPWVGALSLMLDSYIDEVEDAETGSWSAIAYYPDEQLAVERIAVFMGRALRGAAQLRNGHRHVLVIATMIAMYLSSDNATSGRNAWSTRRLRRAGGWLTIVLVPILRCWRVLYRQRR